jgi:hypothetical protein
MPGPITGGTLFSPIYDTSNEEALREKARQFDLTRQYTQEQADRAFGLSKQQFGEQQRQFNTGQSNYEAQVLAQQNASKQAGAGLSSLLNTYNQTYAQNRAENESRYNQMLGIADQTTGQQAADIRSSYGKQAASGMQNLQRLGMQNTTLAPTMKAGIQREESNSLNRLADTMQGTKLGIIASHKTDRELAPDSTLLQSAMSNINSQGGVYGMGALGNVFSGGSAPVAGTPGVATALPMASNPYGTGMKY